MALKRLELTFFLYCLSHETWFFCEIVHNVDLSLLNLIFCLNSVVTEQIGHLQQGLNPPSANMLYFHGPFLGLAIKTGIVTGILALTVS